MSNGEIIPAIIPKSFSDLKEKLSLVAGLVQTVQIDISDGKFTENKTWPNILNPDPDFVKIIREEEGFPFWEEIEFEIHLMVLNPEDEMQKWISAGAKRIIVHYESFNNAERLLDFVKKFKEQFGGSGVVKIELGVALNFETPISVLDGFASEVDFVQLMSIGKLGYQGAIFEQSVLEKIAGLHSAYIDLLISVDGGVNAINAKSILDSGATRLVVGGAIFQSDDIPATIGELKSLIV